MSPQNYEVHFDAVIRTPAYARKISEHSLEKAKILSDKDAKLELITARVFTIFMVEGVIHTLGETLFADWEHKELQRHKAKSGMSLKDRHKIVADLLDAQNSEDYLRAANLLSELKEFRDSFAHPKVIREFNVKGKIKTLEDNFPALRWEKQIENCEKVKGDFEYLKKYVESMCKRAGYFLQNEKENNPKFSEEYPHLCSRRIEDHISDLNILLIGSTRYGTIKNG